MKNLLAVRAWRPTVGARLARALDFSEPMNREQLFLFYEKLYFQELDRREKLSARLNVPLAVMVAIVGFLSFMLNNAPTELSSVAHCFFWALFLFTCGALSTGAWFFKSSWFGHTDKLLPTANATEAYRQQLIALYESYEEKEQLVEDGLKKYLYDYYKEFSSVNTVNNDARAYHLYLATYAITVAALFAFVTYIPYFFINHEGVQNDKQSAATATASSSSEKREGGRSQSSSTTNTSYPHQAADVKSNTSVERDSQN